MGLWNIITGLVATNVGMEIQDILLMMFVLGSFIVMVKDFKIGIIILFLTSGVLFLVFYNFSINYANTISVFFISLVTMVFTLYAASKTSLEGGAVI